MSFRVVAAHLESPQPIRKSSSTVQMSRRQKVLIPRPIVSESWGLDRDGKQLSFLAHCSSEQISSFDFLELYIKAISWEVAKWGRAVLFQRVNSSDLRT